MESYEVTIEEEVGRASGAQHYRLLPPELRAEMSVYIRQDSQSDEA
jgi:hypothetical protein